MFKIELGKEVKAKVTGLVGITTSRSECLYGCNRYYIQPKVGEDKKVPDGWWFLWIFVVHTFLSGSDMWSVRRTQLASLL